MEKSYQTYGRGGELVWSPWFEMIGTDMPKWQMGRKLMNRYRESDPEAEKDDGGMKLWQ